MVYSTRRFVVCLFVCHFVLVFFSHFSIAITSLGEERANLSAFRTFVRLVLVWICRFPLLLRVWEWLPKRGNTKRTEKHKNKMTHGKTYNKSPRRINHNATKSKTNIGTTALEWSVEQTTGGVKALLHRYLSCQKHLVKVYMSILIFYMYS